MLRLIVFFFGGLLLANVVIMTFEAARSAISAKQLTAGAEHKTSAATDGRATRVAEMKTEKAEPKSAAQPQPPQSDWVHSGRFEAHAEPIERPLPQWLRKP